MGLISVIANTVLGYLRMRAPDLTVTAIETTLDAVDMLHDGIENTIEVVDKAQEGIENAVENVGKTVGDVKSDIQSASRTIRKVGNSVFQHNRSLKLPAKLKKYQRLEYAEAEELLIRTGFSNIKAEPLYDLEYGILKSPGKIASIEIDNDSILSFDKDYRSNVAILIHYHSLQEN